MKTNPKLWQVLQTFELSDHGAAFNFERRLAQENGWSVQFARLAIEEYKKFIYLAATAVGQLTPSDIVDQVWHLHLTYTNSYWIELCRNRLGRDLHHNPTRGGSAEDRRFEAQYKTTLCAYEIEFGAPPPAAFWPDATKRFASAKTSLWINRKDYVVLSRRKLRAALAAVILAVLGSTVAQAATFSTSSNVVIIAAAAAAALMLFLIVISSKSVKTKQKSQSTDDGTTALIAAGGTAGTAKSKDTNGDGDGNGDGNSGGDGGSGCGGGCSGS